MVILLKKITCLLLCLAITACTSMHPISTPSTEVAPQENPDKALAKTAKTIESIEAGNRLQLTLFSGKTVNLRVTAIEPDAILGWEEESWKEQRIERRSIVKIERRKLNFVKTAVLLTVGALAFVGLAVIAWDRRWY